MATIIDPLGTIDVVYNLSGTVLIPVTGGLISGGAQGTVVGNDGTAIPHLAGVTIAVITATNVSGALHSAVKLPASADVGDVVEIYSDPSSTADVVIMPPNGEAIGTNAVSTGTNTGTAYSMTSAYGLIFRKIKADHWMPSHQSA